VTPLGSILIDLPPTVSEISALPVTLIFIAETSWAAFVVTSRSRVTPN
jgi:hypothetical protein